MLKLMLNNLLTAERKTMPEFGNKNLVLYKYAFIISKLFVYVLNIKYKEHLSLYIYN